MPTLNWVGKEKVVSHHQHLPYRVLEHKYGFAVDNSGNKIIHEDNLEALKSLLPRDFPAKKNIIMKKYHRDITRF